MKKENYWDLMKISIIVFVVYSLLVMVFPTTSLGTAISSIVSIIVTFFVFGLIGYNVYEKKSKNLKVWKIGAWAGVLTGLISALIGILTFYLFPERIQEILQQAARSGASTQITKSILQIGLYINLVLLPIIYALIGAFISWISFLIFKKTKAK